MEEDEQMKRGIHTLRGQLTLPMNSARRAPLFNGSFTNNFKVIDVQIFQQTIVNNDSTLVNNDTALIMHFDDNLKAGMDANDGRQFGWASIDALAQDWSYVDPDHVIVNDLFILFHSRAAADDNWPN
ncbi:MAG TPA: hypothetical protein EYO33_32965, partial [Phycisphaerales bacterium]|nr:hypothetical protein [Phycisphaerales bacterium]